MVLDCEQLPSSVGIPVSVTVAAGLGCSSVHCSIHSSTAAGALRGVVDLGLSLAVLSGRSNPT